MKIEKAKGILKNHKLRATPARLAVLQFLSKQKHPIGIGKIQSAVPKSNETTLYRMIDDFVRVGMVHAHDLGHGHNDYELANRPHHHHLVCESCGKIEDVTCQTDSYASILKSSSFKKVTHHQTTYFGVCQSCS